MKNLLPIALTTVVFSVSLTTSLPLFAQTLVNDQTKDNTNLLLAQRTAETKTANYTGIVKEINNTAQSISVKIHYQNQDKTARQPQDKTRMPGFITAIRTAPLVCRTVALAVHHS